MRGWIAALFVLVASGCLKPQKTYSFVTTQRPDALDAVVRTLSAEGLSVEGRDPAGIVTTRWRSTGFPYTATFDNRPTVLVRRFVVTIAPQGGSQSVAIRADLMKCAEVGTTIGNVDVRSGCEPVSGVLGRDQEEVDRLGARLRDALAVR
jgi:hypothetical protein